MKFHGRLHPGVIHGPDDVVQLVLHSPDKCKDLVIKVWELDTFESSKGKKVKEGSADDFLAEFRGSVAPGVKDPSALNWREFKVEKANIPKGLPDAPTFKLQLCGAGDTYTIPLVSEAGENEGSEFEIGFSLHHQGVEKFRTKAPCFYALEGIPQRVFVRWYAALDEKGEPDLGTATEPQPLAFHYVSIGVPESDTPQARLRVLRRGYVDAHGYLVARPEDQPGRVLQPILVPAGRKLLAHFSRQRPPSGGDRILAASCAPISRSGTIELLRAVPLTGGSGTLAAPAAFSGKISREAWKESLQALRALQDER